MIDFSVSLRGCSPELARAVRAEFEYDDVARYKLGLIEQARLKRLAEQRAEPGMNSDLGRQQMVLSRNQWLQAMRQFGQLCWADPEFAPWLLKKHEDFRVKDVGTRIQSGWNGKGDSRNKTDSQ